MSVQPRTPRQQRLGDALSFVAGVAAVAYPLALAQARYGTAAPFKFFASDAFYYLNVARRSGNTPFFTYDGTHATNGFHPLWQWLLTALFSWQGSAEPSDAQLFSIYCLSGALVALGVGFLAMAASRLVDSRLVALLCTVPGVYDLCLSKLLVSTIDPTEAAPWTFANGMESSLSICGFGALAWLLLRRPSFHTWSLGSLFLLSGLFSIIFLARLDDIFLLASFGIGTLLLSRKVRPLWQTAIAVGAIPSLTLGAYLLYNWRSVHALLPVSASMKRDSGALFGNLRDALQCLIPTKLLSSRQLFMWDAFNWRALQLCVPLSVAIAFLLHCVLSEASAERGGDERSLRNVLAVFAGYVLLKCGYNLVSVPFLSQGHWYFVVAIAITNLLSLFALARVIEFKRSAPTALLAARVVPTLRLAAGIMLALGAVLALTAHNRSRLLFALLCLIAPSLPVLVSTDRIVSRLKAITRKQRQLVGSVFAALSAAAFLVMQGNAVVNQKVSTTYGDVYYEFWQNRVEIGKELARRAPETGIFEYDDGFMAYALTVPTMSGTGLAIDAEAYPECRRDRCLEVGYRRGFRIMSSVQYWAYANEQSADFRRPVNELEILETLVGRDALDPLAGMERFDFSLVYTADIGRHVVHFLSMRPKAPEQAPVL